MKKIYCDICGRELLKSWTASFGFENDFDNLPQNLWVKMTIQVVTEGSKRLELFFSGKFPRDFCLGCIRRIIEVVERMEYEQGKKTPAEDPEKSELRYKVEEFKSQLEIVAEREFQKRSNEVLKRAKAIIKDPARIKLIDKQLRTPEGLKSVKFILDTLEDIHKKD